ncbi:MAG: hypothetical protein JWN12_594 [Candidatus Saccharibacteria bacterium]|nr:hypothetical protein [Candidatus Saccharibacteria bacterium]
MFRKIVSNLSFSPALVGQLGFYAKRLKKEEATRRLGLIFVALALVVQCLAVFQPPESANAASSNDLVSGGLGLGSNRSINHFLAPYDANTGNLKDIMNYMGISREEIASAQFGSFITGSTKRSWGHNPIHTTSAREIPTTITDPTGKTAITTIYSRPLELSNGPNARIYAYIGHSARVGWFALMQACGNLVTESIPPPITPPVTPPPTPKTPANIVVSKTANNVSQGNVAAGTVAAKESDKITYTLNFENTGQTAKTVKIEDNLTDVLEYSNLIDNGGGTFTDSTKTLSWPDVTLGAGEKQQRTFAIQMMSTIPTTPVGQSNPDSYNCIMNNVFTSGGSPSVGVTIPVTCAPPKVIEQVTTELPHTGPTENMIFAGVILAVVTYFFLRSKQLGKEVRLIRRDLNAGTI